MDTKNLITARFVNRYGIWGIDGGHKPATLWVEFLNYRYCFYLNRYGLGFINNKPWNKI